MDINTSFNKQIHDKWPTMTTFINFCNPSSRLMVAFELIIENEDFRKNIQTICYFKSFSTLPFISLL
jgi:hypothetical protein